MPDRMICDLCGRPIPAQGHYVVRIDVFADPSMGKLSGDELEKVDFAKVFAELMQELQQYSAEELQDQVHRRFEYRLCRPCQLRFIANPLGRPRRRREGEN